MADDTFPTCILPGVATEVADTFCHPIGGSENETVVHETDVASSFGRDRAPDPSGTLLNEA